MQQTAQHSRNFHSTELAKTESDETLWVFGQNWQLADHSPDTVRVPGIPATHFVTDVLVTQVMQTNVITKFTSIRMQYSVKKNAPTSKNWANATLTKLGVSPKDEVNYKQFSLTRLIPRNSLTVVKFPHVQTKTYHN